MTWLVMTKERGGLYPRDPYSAEVLEAINGRRDVMVEIKQARNSKHHKLLFVLLQKVCANDPEGRDVDRLLRDLKLAAGMFDVIAKESVDRATGEVTIDKFYVLESVSPAAMSQERFKSVFDKFLDIIIADILPGTGRDALLSEVLEAIG